MSNTMNALVAGRLSVEPRITQSNTSACFRLSFPRKRKDGESSWINAEIWVPLTRAPYLTDRIKKGALVSVCGSLEVEVYQGKDRWFIKSDDVTILQNPPGFVSRFGDHAEDGHEGHEGSAYPEASGYAPPGAHPVLGEAPPYGQPPAHAGYGHVPQQQQYAPHAPPSYGAPHPGYAAAPPPPSYAPAHQGYAPTPAPAARPTPANPSAGPGEGTLKF